jgi:molybdate transport system substrate-binding protein
VRSPIRRWLLLIAMLLPAASAWSAKDDQRPPIIVFAAASLTDVLQQIAPRYTESSGVQVKLSFAASSALAKQIESGARADVFFSADREWMDYLQQRSLIDAGTRRNLLGNTLVLIAPADSKVAMVLARDAPLLAALGRSGRLATGDPDSVPAGRYARAALRSLNLWETLQPRLVGAENVRAALIYVARGEAPLGIVYSSDALVEPRVRVVATFPENAHPAVTYPVAATQTAGPTAHAFLDYLRSERAREAFIKAGFKVIPVEPVTARSGATGRTPANAR